MSLDLYLYQKYGTPKHGTGIFVREGGENRELTWEEWRERFPDKEPVVATSYDDTGEVWWRNITHNLGKMAREAGIYQPLWHPEEIGEHAKDLIPALEKGLAELKSKPEYYMQFNPENGWGSYEGLVAFAVDFLNACKEYPDATFYASI